MSNDWNNPKGSDGSPSLPGPGEPWEEPKPLHHVSDDEWGTAPPANQGQRPGGAPDPYGQPSYPPQHQQPYAQQPPQGQRPYANQHSGHMTHQPNHYLQPSGEMDSNDVLAIVLSVIFPGVGHMILGQVTKGIVILAATYLTCGVGYFLCAIVAIDAYMVAKVRKTRPVEDFEFFPKN